MIRFAEVFPDETIVSSLSRQLSWTDIRSLVYLDDPLQRDFYGEMCRIERWSVQTLMVKIQSMLFERTAISRKPEELAQKEIDALHTEDLMTPDIVFRDLYFLDFLGLSDSGIRVAEYLTNLPPRELLEDRLQACGGISPEQNGSLVD
jgi:hypothetical protein